MSNLWLSTILFFVGLALISAAQDKSLSDTDEDKRGLKWGMASLGKRRDRNADVGKRPRGHRYGFLGKRGPADDDMMWDDDDFNYEQGKRSPRDDQMLQNYMRLASGMGKKRGGSYWCQFRTMRSEK